MRKLLKCHDCKQLFLREDLINYASLTSKTAYNYCKDCYEKRVARDKFRDAISFVFGIPYPTSRMWGERRRIIEKYGYTDETIIECLYYVCKVLKIKPLTQSLYLVNPTNVEKMKQYKRAQNMKGGQFAAAIRAPVIEKKVSIRENNEPTKKVNWDVDEWLNYE